MDTDQPLVLVEHVDDSTRILTLNRPRKLNALSRSLLVSLAGELAKASSDDNVRCIILTGAGKAFSAGADIDEFIAGAEKAYLDSERLRALDGIALFAKPIIAAVNGYALGGGCELAMACDIIIAADAAIFGQPEAKLASPPGDGGTQRLPRAVGKSMAMQMMLTCEPISAQRAVECGLASECVPAGQLLKRAREVAAAIGRVSPVATRFVKEAVRAAYEMPLSKGLLAEREAILKSFASDDRIEGLRAFKEKRPPRFTGR